MKFSRTLSKKFIDALNSLYDSEESWWRKIVDDKDVFILIRHNELRVQVNGGLLLQINHDSRNNIVCRTHEEYLNLRSEKNPYVVLTEMSTDPVKRVEGLNGFVKHYEKIKNRIKIFTGKERQAVQYLANNLHQIVDVEVGYEGELKENKKSVPRIDMAAITDKGMLVFFEVKLFKNNEMRSEEKPKVVSQLKKYERWMIENRKDIIDGYQEQLNIYGKLSGIFFKKRAQSYDRIDLYPNPRLIITGFDRSQLEKLLPKFLDKIKTGMGWVPDSKDLIATGNHTNLAKSNRLFLGLK